jgi:hypothetical protein
MKIALIGDSHTQVVWPLLKPILEQQGHTITTSQANSGWSAKKYLSTGRVDRVSDGDPDAVIVGLGGNNHDLSDSYGTTVREFLARLGDRRIIWIGAYGSNMDIAESTGKRHEWTGDFLAEHLPREGVIFIDPRPLSRTGHRGDGVHFPRSEYTRIVHAMAPDILSGLTSSALVRAAKKSLPILAMISVVSLGIWVYIRFRDKRSRR